MKNDRDILAEAIARLKREGLSQEAPKSVVDETVRRLAESRPGIDDAGPDDIDLSSHRRLIRRRIAVRLSLAAAALIAIGFVIGRSSGPAPLNMDELRETLAPSLAASIEPAIRARLVEDMEQRYRLALAATYVKVKEELTEQYRDDLNRFAVQTLAASNATTNRLLTELVKGIDTMQTQDLNEVARALRQIEQDRVQDRTQLAAGLQTLASQMTRTRREFVQLLADVRPEDVDVQSAQPLHIPNERNDQ